MYLYSSIVCMDNSRGVWLYIYIIPTNRVSYLPNCASLPTETGGLARSRSHPATHLLRAQSHQPDSRSWNQLRMLKLPNWTSEEMRTVWSSVGGWSWSWLYLLGGWSWSWLLCLPNDYFFSAAWLVINRLSTNSEPAREKTNSICFKIFLTKQLKQKQSHWPASEMQLISFIWPTRSNKVSPGRPCHVGWLLLPTWRALRVASLLR